MTATTIQTKAATATCDNLKVEEEDRWEARWEGGCDLSSSTFDEFWKIFFLWSIFVLLNDIFLLLHLVDISAILTLGRK